LLPWLVMWEHETTIDALNMVIEVKDREIATLRAGVPAAGAAAA
jgi:hypothetical protein